MRQSLSPRYTELFSFFVCKFYGFVFFEPQPVVEEPVEGLGADLASLRIEEATEGDVRLDMKKVRNCFT